ncbi:MAG: Sensor histidine kinase BtsS [Sodalis sp.]|nr:MAG: Sensor histidine kinase BtsS [Sodalis sp.]
MIGTIKLYEAKTACSAPVCLGNASLLLVQIMTGQYERHKLLLTQSELSCRIRRSILIFF